MVNMISQWLERLQCIRDERGLALIESLIAVVVLGTIVVTFTVTLATGALGVRENDQEVVVQGLARTQLEYTKSYAYDPNATTYPTVSAPPGYVISVAVSSVPSTNSNIQKITANITRDGNFIMTIKDYKVNR